jgi:hypothetical protein
MKHLRVVLFGLLMLPFQLLAQGIHPYEHHNERQRDTAQAQNLQQFFRNGTLYGHARYFFMSTDNAPGFSDHFANAFGMGIAYESGSFHGFQIGLSGFFNHNLWSSRLAERDLLTNQTSRYETGLFDLERPEERGDMDRLEDLYLKYSWKNSQITLGKQHIKSAFINPQDGRMRPTLVDGLQFQLRNKPQMQLDGGLLIGISPRSTVKWYGIGQSIGVYPKGVNTDGMPSTHAGAIPAEYLAFLEGKWEVAKGLNLKFSDLYVDRLMNTLLLQAEYQRKFAAGYQWRVAAQTIWQQGSRGNSSIQHDYMAANHQALVYGARMGLDLPSKWQFTINYTHIKDGDRYLMPREWGRDPMFTFMPRERNEGFANVHAFNVVVKKPVKERWMFSTGLGSYQMPDPTDFARNKYGLPSYYQLNLDAYYTFGGWMEGLTGQLLYVYKGNATGSPVSDRYTINRVDMSLWNLVLNYHF